MIFRKMSRHGLSLTIAFAFSSASLIGYPMRAQANSSELWNIKNASQVELDFSRHGRPGRRTAGASRPLGLSSTPIPLTALVPVIDVSPKDVSKHFPKVSSSQKIVLGLTASSYPTFWFYIPYTLEPDTLGELVLVDDKNKVFTKQKVRLSGQQGVVGVRLSPTSKPLAIGKSYRWHFSILLSHHRPSRNPRVNGQVVRVTLDPILESRLQQVTLQERVEIYTAKGIWYEAATLLAEGRYADPTNAKLAADWGNLLHSIDLQELSRKPIQGELQPTETLVSDQSGF